MTTLSNHYAPGLLALLQSMSENAACDFRMTVVTYDTIDPEVVECAENFGLPIVWVPVRELGTFPAPRTQSERMAPNFNKPLVWRLPYEKAVYIDADILCLGSLAEMAEWDELTVVPMQSTIRSVSFQRDPASSKFIPEVIHKGLNEYPEYMRSSMIPWNAGVYGFRPDERTLKGIMWQAGRYRDPVRFGDQVIVNDFFNRERPEVVKYVGYEWNASTWLRDKFPRLLDSLDVRLLHFAHSAKPWKDVVEHQWQTEFWELWSAYYRRAMESVGAPALSNVMESAL